MICSWCDEPITDADPCAPPIPHVHADGTVSVQTQHRECSVRSLIGSVDHLRKTIVRGELCDGTCCDDPALSRRDAARAAYDYAPWVRGPGPDGAAE